MRDTNRVVVKASGPWVRVMSIEALRPRSARSGPSTVSRVRPVASVSSVSGVGPKKAGPGRHARRPVAEAQQRAETRGLKNQPYSLWRSSRPLIDSASREFTSMSSWTNTPGVVKL